MTKEQLQIEVQELTEALKESDGEVKELDEKVRSLETINETLTNEICVLNEKLEEQPVFTSLVDQMKYETFLENYTKFSIEQFALFLKLGDLY